MRSFQLDLDKYDTDKTGSLEHYDRMFGPFVEKKIVLLEIGIFRGGSLQLWRDYFPSGKIVGIDLKLPKDFRETERIHLYKGSQSDTGFLSKVAAEVAPDGFDIIIDDASHIGELTKVTFWHLFDNHLNPGGLYVIEDWGTGYWDDWHDGKSIYAGSYMNPKSSLKQKPFFVFLSKVATRLGLEFPGQKTPMPGNCYGMVGFIKQLVDEQGASDMSRKSMKNNPERPSKFESMVITPHIVFIKKAGASADQ